jgi:hypothetical protein
LPASLELPMGRIGVGIRLQKPAKLMITGIKTKSSQNEESIFNKKFITFIRQL